MRCALNDDDERPTAYGAITTTTTTNKILTVVQHLSPACRAAHFNVASDLAAARILRSVNDVDKDDCNAVQNRLSAVAMDLSSLRVNPSYLLSLLRHCIMSFVQYCWQTSVVDSSIEAWKLFNFPYHLHGGVVPSSSSVLDEGSQHGLQLLTANPPLSDLIPTEIKEMTKNILWNPEPVDRRLNYSSSNNIGELLQASSSSYDDDAILVATGTTFDSAKQRAAAFKRKNLTIDSA
jgi:hypothetical protein